MIMGLFDTPDGSPAVEMEKISVAKTMNLIRIIDWETEVVIYTDTTREGYTSQPFENTSVSPSDAPETVKQYLEKTE
jgi:hypothetical protein